MRRLRHETGLLVAWGNVLSSSWTWITGGKIHLQENGAVYSNLDIFITNVPFDKKDQIWNYLMFSPDRYNTMNKLCIW